MPKAPAAHYPADDITLHSIECVTIDNIEGMTDDAIERHLGIMLREARFDTDEKSYLRDIASHSMTAD